MSSPDSASRETSLYDNLPMHGRQIRLIEITSTNPEIVCKLEVVSLEDEPAYSALSYVWGDPEITRSVLVNGKRVNVAINLASALEHAPKHLEDANVTSRLWADALCINQSDPNEKNHQVPFMKDIYSQAEIVICWLGASDDKVHCAMDWVDVIARECSFTDDDENLQDALHDISLKEDPERAGDAAHEAPNEASTIDRPGGTHTLASYQESLQSFRKKAVPMTEGLNLAWLGRYPSFYEKVYESASGIQELIYIFDIPYWTRVWVFQEVALAKRPLFACGTRSLSLASLQHLARWTMWLGNYPVIVRPLFMHPVQWKLVKFICRSIYQMLESRLEARPAAGHPTWSCLKARAAHIMPEPHWSLACDLETSNPKDYFYGFLSLSCLRLVPDYNPSTSVGMVCRDFMAEYIRASREGLFSMTSGDLDILVFAGVGHGWQEYPGTPSWAPNLPGMKRKDGKGCPVGSFRPINFDHLFLPWFEKAKFVGPDMLSAVLMLDTVQDLGPVRGDFRDANADHEALAILPWIVDFATSRQEYVTGCHPLVALHCMLHFESGIQEGGPGLGIPDFGKTTGFVHWVTSRYKDKVYDGAGDADAREPSPRTEYFKRLLGGLPVDTTAALEETIRLCESCLGKNQRLAETSLGYAGIFPLHAKPGDVVCVMNGLRYPAVLRKADEYYAFVGTCFIQGLESTEQIQKLAEKGGKRVETIVIR